MVHCTTCNAVPLKEDQTNLCGLRVEQNWLCPLQIQEPGNEVEINILCSLLEHHVTEHLPPKKSVCSYKIIPTPPQQQLMNFLSLGSVTAWGRLGEMCKKPSTDIAWVFGDNTFFV